MLTFDTGSNWGVQKSAEELRQERKERDAELKKIAEGDRQLKIEEAKKKEARWAKEAEVAKLAAEKENQEVTQQRNRAAKEQAQQQAQKQATSNKQMSEVEKIEAALKAVKRAKQERSNAMQRAARSSIKNTSSSGSSGTSGTSGTATREPRGRVRVNPVTGALIAVADNANDGKVQEGCLRLDKKYMSAALAAGLGGGKGMYGHIGGVTGMLNSKSNTGGRPGNGPSYSRNSAAAATGRSTGKGSMSRVMATKVGGTTVHSITSKTSNPSRQKLKMNPNFNRAARRSAGACDLGGNPIRGDQKRKNNVKRMVQGRSSSVNASSSGSGNGYLKSKGVVATLGGATSASTQNYQDKKAQEKEAGRQSERLGNRKSTKPRRQGVSKALGGGTSSAPKGDASALRAARLAALERRGIK